MPGYLERMKQEDIELRERIDKLQSYLHEDVEKDYLMELQLHVMISYHLILLERIKIAES